MLFLDLVEISMAVAATRKRGEKVAHLARGLSRLPPEAIESGACFLAGELRQGRIGIGRSTLKATADVVPADLPTLTVSRVDEALHGMAALQGAGSGAARAAGLAALLGQATPKEQDFLRRLLVGALRQGALESLVVDALARATGTPVAAVRRARMLAGALGPVARAARLDGETGLARFTLQVFQPVQPMLAASADSVEAALERLGRAAFELKLDGARVQAHKDGDEVRVFTRQLNDVTAAVPEVVEALRRVPVAACVLDGEVIALDGDAEPLPFQVTMRRFGRRVDVAALREEIPLSVYFFDCLAVDGTSLIDERGETRTAALADVVPANLRVPRLVTHCAEQARGFYEQALARGHEGVMAKSLDALYEAGRRGSGWLKLKHVHTLDLLVIAAEWGSGRRQGWLSNLHLAARDPVSGEPVMLGKTFKGMTDAMLQWQTERLLALETGRDGHVVHVRPELVVEVAFNDVQASPHYPAGLALRFARIKGYREDKSPLDTDTLDTVRALHAGS